MTGMSADLQHTRASSAPDMPGIDRSVTIAA